MYYFFFNTTIMEYIIKDNRKTFNSLTFSNYKKKDIIEELILSIYYQRTNEALKYTSELLVSLYIKDLLYIYITFYCKYIHINNIKFIIYLNKKYNEFKDIANNLENDKELRNDYNIRKLFFTLTIILCNLKKENTINSMKMKINLKNIYEHLKAPNVNYVTKYYKINDPKEYYIAFNEFIYHLEETKNNIYLFYWIDWIIEFEVLSVKNKKQLMCENRTNLTNIKENNNIIFLLWDIIISFSNSNDYINSLFELFIIKYNRISNKKYKSVIYVCIMILIKDDINYNCKLIEDTTILNNIDLKMNNIFKDLIKKQVWIENIKTDKEKLYDSIYNIH